jgi:hypothetical protein
MKSVKTQVQSKQTEAHPEAVQTVQSPKSDSMSNELLVDTDVMPVDSLQDNVARPAFLKSMRIATRELGVSNKVVAAALSEGDALGMRTFRSRLRQIFGDNPMPETTKGLEKLKQVVETEFREVKTGKTDSDIAKRDIDLLLRTVNSMLSAGTVLDEEIDEPSAEDERLDVDELEGEDAEEVVEDLSDPETMDISDQDAETLLRSDVTEIEVVQEVMDWREFRQEEEYEVISVRKSKEEEEEEI